MCTVLLKEAGIHPEYFTDAVLASEKKQVVREMAERSLGVRAPLIGQRLRLEGPTLGRERAACRSFLRWPGSVIPISRRSCSSITLPPCERTDRGTKERESGRGTFTEFPRSVWSTLQDTNTHTPTHTDTHVHTVNTSSRREPPPRAPHK